MAPAGNAADGTGQITVINAAAHTFSYQSHGQPVIANINPLAHSKASLDAYNVLRARIVAATLANLQAAVAPGTIRQAIADLAGAHDANLPAGNQSANLEAFRAAQEAVLTTGTVAQ